VGQAIVQRPEAIVGVRTFRGFGRRLRLGMAGKRKIDERILDLSRRDELASRS